MAASGLVQESGCQRGVEALLLGRVQEAIGQLSGYVYSNPQSFEGNNFLGTALNQAGRAGEAMPYLEAASRLNPQSALPHYQLGVAYGALGQREHAVAQFHRALQLNGSHEPSRLALARWNTSATSTPAVTSATDKAWDSPAPDFDDPSQFVTAHQQPNMGRALLFGMAAAIVGALLWCMVSLLTNFHFGIVGLALGYIVGYAVSEGAESWTDTRLQWMAVGLVVFSFLLGESMEVVGMLMRQAAAMHVSIPLVSFLISLPVTLPMMLVHYPLTLLFVLIGCFTAWRITDRSKAARQLTWG